MVVSQNQGPMCYSHLRTQKLVKVTHLVSPSWSPSWSDASAAPFYYASLTVVPCNLVIVLYRVFTSHQALEGWAWISPFYQQLPSRCPLALVLSGKQALKVHCFLRLNPGCLIPEAMLFASVWYWLSEWHVGIFHSQIFNMTCPLSNPSPQELWTQPGPQSFEMLSSVLVFWHCRWVDSIPEMLLT